jgi:outer membrane lipoprotein SlyB
MDQNNPNDDENNLNDDSFDLFESLDTQPLQGASGQSMPSLGGAAEGGYGEMPSLGGGSGPAAAMSGGSAAAGMMGEGGVDLNLHPSGIVPTLQYALPG